MTNVTIGSTMNITYTFPTANNNNGKISSSTDAISGETVTYQYDSLNRLLSASSSKGWSETYGFDGFGNLLSKTPTGGAPTLSQAVNAATNRIVGQNYDANGNQTSSSTGTLTYDAENRVLTAASNGIQYAYDSRNKRVWSATMSGANMTQVLTYYGVDGQKLGTYTVSEGPGPVVELGATVGTLAVFFGGKRIGLTSGGSTNAFTQDRLGSNGSYYPCGEARGTVPQDQVGFAAYTNDSATGLQYADQRYYASNFGRFMSMDWSVRSLSVNAPQTWNRYAYAVGDPTNENDPDGLCADYIAGITQASDTGSGQAILPLTAPNSVVDFPYAGTGVLSGANEVNQESQGVITLAINSAADSANFALDQSPNGNITLIVFSGGAQAINTYYQEGKLDASKIDYVVYVEPGFGFGQKSNILRGTKGTYWITNPYYLVDQIVNAGFGTQGQLPGVVYESTTCKHDFACVLQQFNFLIAPLLGPKCDEGNIFNRLYYKGSGGGDAGNGPIPGQQNWCLIFGGSWCPATPVE